MSDRPPSGQIRPDLRPSSGRKLPKELRAGHVGLLAGTLARGVLDPGFEPLLKRIDDNAPVLGGNEVEVYFRGEDAFPVMCEAIAAAEREVLLEFFVFRDDKTGRQFLEALAAAAARGVTVRVLADALGSHKTGSDFWREMESRGIELRLYNPTNRRSWLLPFRDHRKILAIDRRVGFTGGMNIGEEYGSPDPEKKGWRDTHVRVTGPAAWGMVAVFCEEWGSAGGSPVHMEPIPAEVAEAPEARILVLESHPARGWREVAAVLAAIVGAARRYVWITNAYFAPGSIAIQVLGDAARRGIDVRLLLSGKTDSPLVRRSAHGHYADLLARGVRIFEYEANVLHAKSMVVDDQVAVVGSTNLDVRSFLFNSECNLVILDRATAETMAEGFRNDLEDSWEIKANNWRDRPLLEKAGDRLARWLRPFL
ncbi:MAG TPA: phospholipase D-like domain-containing protein [Thermoanaerobaculia bacterium]|nr:phospholipase D-like domain-containing protein [Thermoanaerobaculia bacterium]